MSATSNQQSAFFKKHCTPWWADIGDEAIVIRDRDGKAICVMPRADGLQERADQEAHAQLLAVAPELFVGQHLLIDVMVRSDAENFPSPDLAECSSDEWDAALEESAALLGLLADEGITFGEEA
jgi:hypothetical protein